MNDTRERIAGHVSEAPGVHFRGLVRALDLAPGQVQYHLRRLERADRVEATAVRGRTHYFAPDVEPEMRCSIALCRRETARDVLVLLAARGPTPPGAVADDLDVARSTLEHHLDGLVAADLVRKEYDSHGHVSLRIGDEARVATALDAVRPTLPERLVDRFTRLVDGLLDEP